MDWTDVLAVEDENPPRLAAELLASKAYGSTAERIRAFMEQGGGGRATFFNIPPQDRRREVGPAPILIQDSPGNVRDFRGGHVGLLLMSRNAQSGFTGRGIGKLT